MKLERIPWPGPGTPNAADIKARLESEGYSVWQWTDAPGSTYTPHTHDHDESIWCLEGEITFGANDTKLTLAAGDRLMLPQGTVHTAEAGHNGATYLIGER